MLGASGDAGPTDYMQLSGTDLSDQRGNGDSLQSDTEGRFNLTPGGESATLLAATPEGFASAPGSDFTNTLTLTVQPWGRIEGVFLKNGRPVAGEELYFSADNLHGSRVWSKSSVSTDSEGRFAFSHVPPGSIAIQQKQPMGLNSDHAAFWQAGIPALFIFDSSNARAQIVHTTADTIDKIDFDRLVDITQALAATVADERTYQPA